MTFDLIRRGRVKRLAEQTGAPFSFRRSLKPPGISCTTTHTHINAEPYRKVNIHKVKNTDRNGGHFGLHLLVDAVTQVPEHAGQDRVVSGGLSDGVAAREGSQRRRRSLGAK